MVCNRCIVSVSQALERLKLHPIKVSLGEVELDKPPTDKQLDKLNYDLKQLGFELLDTNKTELKRGPEVNFRTRIQIKRI